MKIIPRDVKKNKSIIKDDNFITVIDPRHTNSSFHYTAWCNKDIASLLDLTRKDIPMLKSISKKFAKYKNKKFKTLLHFPPTFWRLHLHFVELNHVVPEETPSYEVFDVEDIITKLNLDENYYRKRVRIVEKL